MPSDFNTIRYILQKLSKGNYTTLMRMLHNSMTFDISDAAKYRLHVLDHYYKHGWRGAVDAFGVGKSTLYDWRKAFESSNKKLSSLIPVSTRPKNLRQMTTDVRMEVFIRALREEFGNISKYKVKLFLDEYAKSLGLSSYGTTKIAKIIRRRNYFFEGKFKVKRKKKPLTPRIKYAPKEKTPGYIGMDSITLYVTSRKYNFITAIDILTKFAWVRLVKSLSGLYTRLTLEEFQSEYNYPVHVVQTDNGSEFLGKFNQYLESVCIKHEYIYPRSPKINGVVERFNRTIQNEFIERHDDFIYDEVKFKQKLTNYLVLYNTKRPHYSLNYRTPVEYLKIFNSIPKSM